MDKLPIDILLEIIPYLDVEAMLSLGSLSKKLKEVISRVTSLSLEQTSSYLTHFKDFKAKYNNLMKIMPNLKSMKIHLIINPKEIISGYKGRLPFSPRMLEKESNEAHEPFRNYYLAVFSWLDDIKIKIDCSMEARESYETMSGCSSSAIINYLLFEARGNFRINKYKQNARVSTAIIGSGPKPNYPEIEFKTCFKMKDGIMTINDDMHHCSGNIIYRDTFRSGVKCSTFKIWSEVKGIKVKYPPPLLTCRTVIPQTGKICNTRAPAGSVCKCGKKTYDKAYVDISKLHDEIKGLPITCDKEHFIVRL